MARRTKEQEQAAEVGPEFPYTGPAAHPAWEVVDQAIADLEANNDLELQTARKYVIGYLVQALIKSGVVPPAVPEHLTEEERRRYSWILVYAPPAAISGRRPQTAK